MEISCVEPFQRQSRATARRTQIKSQQALILGRAPSKHMSQFRRANRRKGAVAADRHAPRRLRLLLRVTARDRGIDVRWTWQAVAFECAIHQDRGVRPTPFAPLQSAAKNGM